MANNEKCKTVGVKSIQIRMFEKIMQTLMDMPNQKKMNLTSLGILYLRGVDAMIRTSKVCLTREKVGTCCILRNRQELLKREEVDNIFM